MTTNAGAFPHTTPALRAKVIITALHKVGTVHTGSDLVVVPFGHGTLESLPGFEPAVKMAIPTGADWLYVDHSKGQARVNVKAVAVDDEGIAISFGLNGILTIDEAVGAIMSGHPDAKSTPFGQSIEILHFEVGHEKYKFLEQTPWAVSMRFFKEGDATGVEFAAAKLTSGTGFI